MVYWLNSAKGVGCYFDCVRFRIGPNSLASTGCMLALLHRKGDELLATDFTVCVISYSSFV